MQRRPNVNKVCFIIPDVSVVSLCELIVQSSPGCIGTDSKNDSQTSRKTSLVIGRFVCENNCACVFKYDTNICFNLLCWMRRLDWLLYKS